ncbi:hypothetical protein C8J56DRAFT_879568 [Mycena floridula]|nr:hypothetical protein C8J56DRAFT_879568 [Mycena floridula]
MTIEFASGGMNHYHAAKSIKVLYGNNNTAMMALHGITYFVNGNHFSSRVITKDNEVWYNDGMVNGGQSRFEGSSWHRTASEPNQKEHGGGNFTLPILREDDCSTVIRQSSVATCVEEDFHASLRRLACGYWTLWRLDNSWKQKTPCRALYSIQPRAARIYEFEK